MKFQTGLVYLVGAGPGDPGLITLRGAEVLRKADVVLYDYLANERLLTLAPKKARLIFVGKGKKEGRLKQESINRLMIRKALSGKVVVRLKGGDPFVFGRGGEEALALADHQISFEIVPGITSPIAAPAYAGIPMTHRDYASTVVFVTGHESDEKEILNLDWDSLCKIETIVFLMGVKTLPVITQKLVEAGLSPSMPVAVVQWGTLPYQRVVVGILKTIAEKVKRENIDPPAIIIIGSIVALRNKLRWFDKRPLLGKRILVTRAREQANELAVGLEALGALVYEIPTIEIRPPSSWRGIDRAISRLSDYDWLIFTSANAVRSFFQRLKEKGRDIRDLVGIKIAAIGPATAREIEGKGVLVDSIAGEYQAEGVIKIFGKKKIWGKRILIPRARQGREILIQELTRLGAKVDWVEAYRTGVPSRRSWGDIPLHQLIEERKIDLMTFASSSTIDNFMKMAGKRLRKEVCKIPVAVIGPVTATTAREHQLNVKIEPRRSHIPALMEAIARHFSARLTMPGKNRYI
ncbi:MAG: uroporphyrinogen-III C-methyltransferase [Deltaproteobacteria bacterium]|nr:uroporphyrinogen-III C-methyltransferase [Deltaproteobacteria bacterium]